MYRNRKEALLLEQVYKALEQVEKALLIARGLAYTCFLPSIYLLLASSDTVRECAF
jgi:hypothetical protein